MKTKLAVIVILVIFFFVGESKASDQEDFRQQAMGSRAIEMMEEMIYIKDQKSGICFAMYSQGHYSKGQFGMTAVPCEAIPKNILLQKK